MQLTQYTDLSLRVLIYLTRLPQPSSATIAEIAEFHGVSRNHLMKVVTGLAAKGLINTIRGKGGGLSLGRPAHTIMIGEVVRGMEPDFNLVECFNPSKNRCVIAGQCGLQGMLHEARRDFLKVLDGYTLAEAAGTVSRQPTRGKVRGRAD